MRSLRMESKQLTEVTYDAVKKLIITCGLVPGEIVKETALADQLGVSRSPLRSALARLRGERFVVYDTVQRNFRIAPIDAKYVGEIYRVRSPLECLCALEALDAVHVDELEKLLVLAEEIRTDIDASWEEFLNFDRKVHSFISAHCANDTLLTILGELEAHWERINYFLGKVAKEASEQWFSDCLEILEAFKKGDEAAVIRSVAAHIDGAAEVYLSHITGHVVSLGSEAKGVASNAAMIDVFERARRLAPSVVSPKRSTEKES